MTYVGNAFSLAMLGAPMLGSAYIEVAPVSQEIVSGALSEGAVSVVGHESTALLYSALLGVPCPVNRATLRLGFDDVIYVGQYMGPRLPEGATSLPDGAQIQWLRVRVVAAAR